MPGAGRGVARGPVEVSVEKHAESWPWIERHRARTSLAAYVASVPPSDGSWWCSRSGVWRYFEPADGSRSVAVAAEGAMVAIQPINFDPSTLASDLHRCGAHAR